MGDREEPKRSFQPNRGSNEAPGDRIRLHHLAREFSSSPHHSHRRSLSRARAARRILRRSGRAPPWESLRGPVRRPFLAYPPFPGRGGSLWTPERGSEASLPQRNTYMPRTEGLQPGPHVNHPCARRRLWERYFVYYVYSRTRRSVGLLSALSVITDVRRAVESKFGRRGVAWNQMGRLGLLGPTWPSI